MKKVQFTVKGQRAQLTDEEVKRRLRGIEPGTLRSHAVDVGGVLYPVKQAFAAATGFDLLDFNTNQARDVLRRLGFDVIRTR